MGRSDDWAHALSTVVLGIYRQRWGDDGRLDGWLPMPPGDATTGAALNQPGAATSAARDRPDNSMALPLIATSAGSMCEGMTSIRGEISEESDQVKIKFKEQESDQKMHANESIHAPAIGLTAGIVENNTDPAIGLTAGIVENNTELTEQIVNALALTNSISGLDPDPGPQALGTAPLAASTASVASSASGPELSLLSLLSSSSNLLTPNDMALPLNDPSIFLPTPFAPGQNANTLLQQQQQLPTPFAPGQNANTFLQQQQQQHIPVPSPAAPTIAHMDVAIHAAANPPAIPSVSQHHLLQQLATGYAAGGAPMYAPTSAGGGLPPSLMSGLIPPHYPMGGNLNPMVGGLHLYTGIPPGLNPGIADIPVALHNPGIAGIPLGLNHPGIAGIHPGLNHPRMLPFANMGNISDSSTNSSLLLTNQPRINDTMASASRQSSLAQGQLNGINAESSAVDSAPQQNPNSFKNKNSSSSPVSSDLLIKSREARWIIRYNELSEFRGDHGHCRVPHGYAPNRKLSWWVMNQRAQFAHRNQGKKTWLSDDRIQLLDDIGFIWTPHLKRSSGGKKKGRSESSAGEEDENNEESVSESKEDCKGGRKEESPDDNTAPM